MKTYKEILEATLAAMTIKNIEVRHPIEGMRHNKKTIHVRHRFPVNGGITAQESLIKTLSEANPIIALVRGPK